MDERVEQPACQECGQTDDDLRLRMEGLYILCGPCVQEQRRRARAEKAAVRYRRWKAAHPGAAKENQLQRNYGISLEQYTQMVERQGGVCWICQRPESRVGRGGEVGSLCVDHHHKSGMVRGALCASCNTALGLMDESPDRLRTAASYLNYWEQHMKGQTA